MARKPGGPWGRVRCGDHVPYASFVSTRAAPSTLSGGGDGLFAIDRLAPFTWIGFYPGTVSARFNGKRKDHTMGTIDDAFIIADAAVKAGMHMINEAGRGQEANVWYAKLESGHVLYFAGKEVQPGEELLTCYSRSYGKRSYSTPAACADPRCTTAKHRLHSRMVDEWRQPLLERAPLGLPPQFLGRGEASSCDSE